MSLEKLKAFVERIARHLEGKATIILFGSYARGNYNLASDFDIIVISDKLKGNPLERTRGLYMLNEEFLPVDIIAYTRKEFLKALENLSPSALDAMEYGKVLYDDGFYNVAKKKFEELKKKGLKKERYWMMAGL
ncbi:nucleotidyltransferase domain-containing protein [Thermococcus sibiricus]|uniref:DNA polymerase, beta domain protein region n=2 Tax=Thermococcus sibiricus TaxID=172049 RepID=C6A096_THESM|nr:nucleotidyltransferase domain-containing protein [Thermococcus sibiricus]ACS91077.1 DNA polymerase, beta domain protein region [Thermococcus sibiricus MM 739]KUK17739.1 MAG: DNA polymerase, beta domain protein region [Thermococcus sibiricus]